MAFPLEQAYSLLSEAHSRGRLAHAYLVVGSKGSGKESLACRLIGLTQGIAAPSSLDEAVGDGVTVLRPSGKSRSIKVEDVRALEETVHLTVARSALKIGIIVDADRMNIQGQNSFLKTLEEPPNNTLLLLLTEAPEQLLATILSRCIEVPLVSPARLPPAPDSAEGLLLELLANHGTLAARGLRPAFILARGFADIIAARKEAIAAHHKAAFTEEVSSLRKSTDGGDWISDREKAVEAMVEADYLSERNRLIGTLLSWFADAIRIKAGSPNLDLPERRDAAAKLASNATTDELLRRQTSMERLGELFGTNASEQLAIEVCFLRAFE